VQTPAARFADRHHCTLIICTGLYVAVAAVLTGVARIPTLGNAAPVADALKALGMDRLRLIVTAGALIGMISSLLVFQYGQARVWFAMSRDRLLPKTFSAVHPKYKTPHKSTWIAGLAVGIPAGIWDIATFAEPSRVPELRLR
jgi:basic amino acid/polyamine antiporter, APA family